MQLINLTVLVGLAASVSAIDVGLRSGSNCNSNGGGWLCTNLNPNTCCGIATGSVSSVIFYAIPRDWFLQVRGHEGGSCGRVRTTENVQGATERCLSNGQYTGAGYSFNSRKRGIMGTPEDVCAASATCTPVLPDQLSLSDGQKYNIVDMDTGLLEELTELMINGSVASDVPEVFKSFEVSA
ncbi:uncharacterized protein RAG0_09602 [Rhynchosporium agropyri]|uniref:Uncharacterized protein n=2 Tax=Rhynchosporium TaxID=38037 RepID=A0A1E1KW76_9HELO|nr:uncharacterized protein RCO7_02334 [Rhynchosporium commune]CZT02431.1 uncharacterized protein RAG0_09602 [Rhynchosporium agropyri]